jgi:hypothetical protein
MINAELSHVTTLSEFHKEIVRQQTEAHGEHYCDHHAVIEKLAPECKSYLELGTHQGGTASCAILQKFNHVQLVDIDMHRYRKFLQPIAEQFSKNNNINLVVLESSSLDKKTTYNADLMLIDSVHNTKHMSKELAMHGNNIQKYILAHDTHRLFGKVNTSLYNTLENFCKTNPWEVVERNTVAEGYTLLKRKV